MAGSPEDAEAVSEPQADADDGEWVTSRLVTHTLVADEDVPEDIDLDSTYFSFPGSALHPDADEAGRVSVGVELTAAEAAAAGDLPYVHPEVAS